MKSVVQIGYDSLTFDYTLYPGTGDLVLTLGL
jgi:hypothetical protein